MPNKMNVEEPITLVGPGRSGSTLLTNVFRQHPEFQSLGETTNLIFSPYYYMRKALPFCGPRPHRTSVDEAAKIAIHAALTRTYQSKRPHWFHKPIMLPVIAREFESIDDFAAWYWAATRELFPRGKFFTVMRAPERVIQSSMTRWKHTSSRASENLARLYRVLLHPESRVEFGVVYEELVSEPHRTLQDLFAFTGVKLHESWTQAFARQHASNDQAAAAAVERQLANEPLSISPEVAELHGALMGKLSLTASHAPAVDGQAGPQQPAFR
jgi:hypothetical protein